MVEMDREIAIRNAMEQYKEYAVKNAVDAFNEGYLLGVKYAKQVYGEEQNEN